MFAGGATAGRRAGAVAAAITESPLGSHAFVCAVPGGWSPLPGAERLLFFAVLGFPSIPQPER